MTLNDIIVSALAQLDRGHDAQTLDTWRDKFTRFANEAVIDLSAAWCPRRTEDFTLSGKLIDTGKLQRECIRVHGVKRLGRYMTFFETGDSGVLCVPGAKADSTVQVNYRFAPHTLSSTSDVPELPDWCHGLIVCYVVGRERASGEVGIQRGSNIYFQMYEAGKAKLRPHMGGVDSYRILNRW